MRAIKAPEDILTHTNQLKNSGKSIGLVPTMGALHEGHLSLVKKSIADNDVTVVSIFVNPLQFNNQEDLNNYPLSLEEDKSQLESLGVDYVFEPSANELYAQDPVTAISFGELEHKLEGEFRPGHFSGVGIVVNKLFNLTNPSAAYFGLKDLQQYFIIKKMVEDFSIPVQIIGVDTIRETSGLAMSSRNRGLSEQGLAIAANIFKGLSTAKKEILSQKDLDDVKKDIRAFYESIDGLEVEYLEILNPENFESINGYTEDNELAIFFAGYVEKVRLIDNLYLRPTSLS